MAKIRIGNELSDFNVTTIDGYSGKKRKKRKLTDHNICMRKYLRENRMKGKSKAQRKKIFREGAEYCSLQGLKRKKKTIN